MEELTLDQLKALISAKTNTPSREYLEWVWKEVLIPMSFNAWIPIIKIPYVDTPERIERFKSALNYFFQNETYYKVDFGIEWDEDGELIRKSRYLKNNRIKITLKTKQSIKGLVEILRKQYNEQ